MQTSTVNQIYKGVVGLSGLVIFGSAFYWLKNWIWGNSQLNTNVSSNEKVFDTSLTTKNDNSVAVTFETNNMPTIGQPISPKLEAANVLGADDLQLPDDFKDDDLVYRDPEINSKGQTDQVQLLSSGSIAPKYSFISPVVLEQVVNSIGIQIYGETEGDQFGRAVSSAGDLNDDGVADVVIGAYGVNSNTGAGYVIFGNRGVADSPYNITVLDGTNGFKIPAEKQGKWWFGYTASMVRDINGDGKSDILLGAVNDATKYVIFGKASFTNSFNLSALDGLNGFKVGAKTISGAGDVNGDGNEDIVVSVTGSAYVIFGNNKKFDNPFILSRLNGTNGFKINGETIKTASCCNIVSSVGDVNGDSFSDVALISHRDGLEYINVIFGHGGGWKSYYNISSLNGTDGFRIIGDAAASSYDYTLSPAGDYNRDGIDDFVIGDFQASRGSSYTGSVYLIFGHGGGWNNFNLSSLNGTDGFRIDGAAVNERVGSSLSPLGDVNKDGFADVIIGGGRVSYVLLGTNAKWTSPFSLVSFSDKFGTKIVGGNNNYNAVSSAGDFNGDGFLDIIIGDYYARINDFWPGGAYILFGGGFNLVNNSFNIYQSSTNIITNSMLSVNSTLPPQAVFTFTIFNINYGAFYLDSALTLTFTKQQIAANRISFIHDGTFNAPSFQITVDNGFTAFGPVDANINFSSKPWLVKNQLTIFQGGSVPVTNDMLSASVIGSDPMTLRFIINNLLHGRFVFAGDLNIPLTNFTQASIFNSSQLLFIHDGSRQPPSFDTEVSDGITTTASTPAQINFRSYPYFTAQTILAGQGQLTPVTSKMLNAYDSYSDPDNLVFYIDQQQFGNFVSITNQSYPLNSFLQRQIASGLVGFKQDGSQNLPILKLKISNGVLTTNAEFLNVKFDIAPIINNNNIIIGQGQTLVLLPTMLGAVDVDNGPDSLTFIVANVTDGSFDATFNPGIAISQFTQSQINNYFIRLVHSGTFNSPSFFVSVNDGVIATPYQKANITFYRAPVLLADQLFIAQGQEVVLASDLINATSSDTDSEQLIFIPSEIQHCQFVSVTTGQTVSQFEQRKIIEKSIKVVHDNTNVAPTYMISIYNGIFATTPHSAVITFYRAPLWHTNTLTVYQGQNITVTPEMLTVMSFTSNANNIFYDVYQLKHGKFTLQANLFAPVLRFSQQNIINNELRFVHDNSATKPICRVIASDRYVSLEPVELQFIFDAAPVLTANQLSINQNEEIIITPSMISASDVDSNANQLRFKVSKIKHGEFLLKLAPESVSTQPTTIFFQQQISSELVSFRCDDSGDAPEFALIVDDGFIDTLPRDAVITFFASTLVANVINNTLIASGISGAVGFLLWFVKKYFDSKSQNVFAGPDFPNQVCFAIMQRVKISSCFGYISLDDTAEFRLAVDTLIDKLTKGQVIKVGDLSRFERAKLAEKIAIQVEKVLLPTRTCRNKFIGFFTDFCVAEVESGSIIDRITDIVDAVNSSLSSSLGSPLSSPRTKPLSQQAVFADKEASVEMTALADGNNKSIVETIKRLDEALLKLQSEKRRLLAKAGNDNYATSDQKVGELTVENGQIANGDLTSNYSSSALAIARAE